MNGFSISNKASVIFGKNASRQTGSQLQGMGIKKVLCIYGKVVKGAGTVDKIVRTMEGKGIQVIHFDGVLPDPPDYVVDEAAEMGRKESVGAVVAIGGGSSIDIAKGVVILLSNPGKISDYFLRTDYNRPLTPLIAIPTTSGTGSEVTTCGVITFTAEKRKSVIIGPACIATLAIIDPLLTVSLPAFFTASTGMDTFAHAVESMTVLFNQNSYSIALAQKAVSLVYEYLPKTVASGSDLEARENMSLACLLAGTAFADANVHIGHSIAHAIGALHHIPHGAACAIALPSVIRYIADAVPENVKMVGFAMGLDMKDGLSAQEAGDIVAEAIKGLSKKIGIPTLKELKIPEADFDKIADIALQDICVLFYPKPTDKDAIISILKDAYKD